MRKMKMWSFDLRRTWLCGFAACPSIVLMVIFAVVWMALVGPANAATPPCVPPNSQNVELLSKSREGETVAISAHLLKPVSTGPFPALVLLHGQPGGLQPGYLCVAEKMVHWGYVTLVIDSNSAASRNREQSIGSYLDTEQAQDAHQGRSYLSGLRYVDSRRIGVVGWSKGGRAALAAVSSHRSDYKGKSHGVDKEGPFAVAVAIYPVCLLELKDLSAPLLLLIGAKDTTVSARYCQEMLRDVSAPHDIELKVYPEAGHGFDGPWSGWSREGAAAVDARSRIRRFLTEHLE